MQVVIQKEVQFYDDQLTAVQTEDGRIYVSINEVCGVLGLSRYPQQRRITYPLTSLARDLSSC